MDYPMGGGAAGQPYREYQRHRQLTLSDLLLENRIIFVEGGIDDAVANQAVMKFLFLQSEKRDVDIHMYINSPGGYIHSTLAIYDTMQFLSCDVCTYCVGMAASGAAILLAGGAAGKRFALPHAKVMMHQPSGMVGGQISDIEIQAEEIIKNRQVMNQILAEHTGKKVKDIARDTERDFYMSAEEAKKYGLLDEVLKKIAPEK